MATAAGKLIIIKKSLAQTNTDPFSLLSNRVVSAGVSVVCLGSAFAQAIFPVWSS